MRLALRGTAYRALSELENPVVLVFMGVSGSGKTTVARILAGRFKGNHRASPGCAAGPLHAPEPARQSVRRPRGAPTGRTAHPGRHRPTTWRDRTRNLAQ